MIMNNSNTYEAMQDALLRLQSVQSLPPPPAPPICHFPQLTVPAPPACPPGFNLSMGTTAAMSGPPLLIKPGTNPSFQAPACPPMPHLSMSSSSLVRNSRNQIINTPLSQPPCSAVSIAALASQRAASDLGPPTKIPKTEEWRTEKPDSTKQPSVAGTENNGSSNALDRIRYALEQKVHSDCSFAVGPEDNVKIINGHRILLALASPVFSSLFYSSDDRLADGPIKVPDVDPVAFEALLKFIYSDVLLLNSTLEAQNLCFAAKKYEIPHLIEKCVDYLVQNVSPDTVYDVLEFSHKVDSKHLEDSCLKIMQERTKMLLAKVSFLEVERSTLIAMLQLNPLHVESELELINMCVAWAKTQVTSKGVPDTVENMREALGSAFGCLRFLTIEPQEFASAVATCGLFTSDEAHNVLLRLLGNRDVKLPAGIHESTLPRICLLAPGFETKDQVCACPTGLHEIVLFTNNNSINRTRESRVTIRCDRDIRLYGLQVGAQVNYPLALQAFSSSFVLQDFLAKSYKEDLWVQLIIPEYHLGRFQGWVAEDITFQKPVNYNSMIELRFAESILIKKFNMMELRITHFKEGVYPKGAWHAAAPCGVVNFNFESANANHECVLNLISSLIFSVEDK